jgi:hypothetical protein
MDDDSESVFSRFSDLDIEVASVDTLVDQRSPTPLPKVQIGILMAIQLAEPISSSLIYPFINQVRLPQYRFENISLYKLS